MRIRLSICVALFGVFLPGRALAAQGILLLADEGTPEWNAHVTQLAATVDKQKPTEAAFWSATNPTVQAAVNRLVQRGASEIIAVPLFVAAPPSDIGPKVKSSVPMRFAAPLDGDPILPDIVLGRADEISRNSAGEVLVVISHRSATGSDKRWIPDLRAVASQLNRQRRFATILSVTVPADASEASANDVAQLRRTVERYIAMGRRIVVVPVLTPYGETESAIKERLQGLPHELANSALMPDDRLVAWILSRAEEK